MKVVVDTNVIVSGFLSPTSYTATIIRLCMKNAFQILVSKAILNEYEKVLAYPHLGVATCERQQFIALLKKAAYSVTPTQNIAVVRDPSDNKFLECAVAGQADYLVSSDPDLLDLREYQGIHILSPAAFLEQVQHEPEPTV